MPLPRPYVAFRRLPAPVQGTLWAVIASAFFAGMIGVIRHLADELPPLEIVFFRNFFGFAFMIPWLVVSGVGAITLAPPYMRALATTAEAATWSLPSMRTR